jgi:hypothetical protein
MNLNTINTKAQNQARALQVGIRSVLFSKRVLTDIRWAPNTLKISFKCMLDGYEVGYEVGQEVGYELVLDPHRKALGPI